MTGRTHNRARAKFKCALVAVLICAGGVSAYADRWVLLVEPSFMDHKMRRPIEGSERTVLAMARVIDGEIVPLTRDQKRGIPVTYPQIESAARETASVVLSHLEPVFVRDANGVIDHAVIESGDPLTASAVLAPGFAEMFADTLGPDLLVAMPTRFQILVFSRQDTAFERMREQVIASYLSSTYPVSREIFALERGRLRSMGVYQ